MVDKKRGYGLSEYEYIRITRFNKFTSIRVCMYEYSYIRISQRFTIHVARKVDVDDARVIWTCSGGSGPFTFRWALLLSSSSTRRALQASSGHRHRRDALWFGCLREWRKCNKQVLAPYAYGTRIEQLGLRRETTSFYNRSILASLLLQYSDKVKSVVLVRVC